MYLRYDSHVTPPANLLNRGADNSYNGSNPDTSMKFGKKHPNVILLQNQS